MIDARTIKELSPEVQAELTRFAEEIERLESGAMDPDDFKRFRLENGVYGIRGSSDRHMIRIKIRFGRMTPEQLEAVADLAERYTPTRLSHVTTRQDIQLHNVLRADVPALLTRIAEVGLTTREACGNTVRNVTACPFAGVSQTEVFDVTPYADKLSLYFLRNPLNQNLPRKFKFAFEGCTEDHARVPIHDFGAVAKVREKGGKLERGFHLYLAGGLGAQPRSADLLEEFTPADLLIPTAEAAIRIFDRYGERRPEQIHRMRARIKFLARSWGMDKLREAVLKERRFILATRSGLAPYHIEPLEEAPPGVLLPLRSAPPRDGQYDRWLETNVIPQKQPGWTTVIVRCLLGDIDPRGLRRVADVARRYCGGRIRTAISQNLILRWIPKAALPWVYAELAEVGLAGAEAHRIADITRCPGADTCQIALTHSRGLADGLGQLFLNGFAHVPELQDISIKISGCMNSCGQHHIADIGFYGASTDVDGHELPQYIVMLGGRTREGVAEFGKVAGKITARLVPDAVRQLLNFYLEYRRQDEQFRDFVDRIGVPKFKELLEPFNRTPSFEQNRELFYDLGAEEQVYKSEMGVGECAS